MDSLLIVGASLRLTRFITTDYLGHWWIVRPARAWALRHWPAVTKGWTTADGQPSDTIILADHLWHDIDEDAPTMPWQVKLVKGLDCPFCVGFWLGGAVILTGIICTALGPIPRAVWRFGVATFALNYLVGHVSKRIED